MNDVDANGETALHGAVYRGGTMPVLQFLIEKGARLDVENSKKWSPLFVADGVEYASSGMRRYPEAAALLRQAMVAQGIAADETGRLVRAAGAAADGGHRAAAPMRTTWDGVFTAAQVKRGQAVYARACSACHLDSLQGDAVSPPLLGPGFVDRYAGSSLPRHGDRAAKLHAPERARQPGRPGATWTWWPTCSTPTAAPRAAAELPVDVNALMRIAVTSRPQGR